MACKILLQKNSNLHIVTNEEGQVGIGIKADNEGSVFYFDESVLWVEEIPQLGKDYNISKAAVFSNMLEKQLYSIEEIIINNERKTHFKSLIAITRDVPLKIHEDIYKYFDINDKIWLVNFRTNTLNRLEDRIIGKFKKVGLKVSSVNFIKLDNKCLYELIVGFGELDNFYIKLKLDNRNPSGYKVCNTIYSDSYKEGIKISLQDDDNSFISEGIFFNKLLEHDFCKELVFRNVKSNNIMSKKRIKY